MQSLINNHDLILMEAAIVEPIRRGEIVALDPRLVHGSLIYDEAGRNELSRLYLQYAKIAANANVPFLMCTPTWRTNLERVQQAGVDQNINFHAVEFLGDAREKLNNAIVKIGGTIGCKNDCYQPEESLSANESEKFHSWQINQLAEAGVDFLFGVTLPAVDEALGIARAMASTDKPYFVSFVISREGRLLDGTTLVDAIEQIDNSTSRTPLGYMINCAYPTFLCANHQPKSLFTRLVGFQGNASSLDHDQLDRADDLQADDLVEWGDAMVALHRRYGIKILGGCCGTNADHLRYIADQLTVNRSLANDKI